MTGDLISRLTGQGRREDAAFGSAMGDEALPLHMSSLGDALGGALGDRESDRLGANLDMAVANYGRRLSIRGVDVQRRSEMIRESLHAIERAQDILESPIERAMLPWLVFGSYNSSIQPAPICLPQEDAPPAGDIFIAPQLPFGRYRLDFGIVVRSRSRSLIVAVECDGAAFHDRRSDIRRDAFMAAFRIPTVRATGSEIRTDPRPIVWRVGELIAAWSAAEGG